MEVQIEQRPGCVVAMTVKVEADQVREQMGILLEKAARRINIPGFRPGKAPRKLVEERIDHAALAQDAVEAAMNASFKEALREHQLEPLDEVQMEDMKTGEDMSVTYTVTFPARPVISLPPLNELEVNYTVTTVTDEQVEAEITRLREQSADFTEVEEGIQKGDYVTIGYTMTVNGEPYPDGDMSGYPLEVGTDTFFPELNEGLLGLKRDETTTLTVNYPDDYSNKDLAGKTAVFTVTIEQVRRRQIPEATDEWVVLMSNGEAQNLDDLRRALRAELQRMAAQMDRSQIREALMRQLQDRLQFDLPEKLVDEAFDDTMHDLEHRLARERLTLEEYAEMSNRSVATIENEQHMLARETVRRSLVLQQLAREGQIVLKDEEIDQLVLIHNMRKGEMPFAQVQKRLKRLRNEMEKSGELDNLMNTFFREKIYQYLESQAQVHLEGIPADAEVPSPLEETVEAAIEAAETEVTEGTEEAQS